MSFDTPRIRRLLRHAKDYEETGKISDSALNGSERSLVRSAVRSGDAASYIQRHCHRPDQTPSLLSRIASQETWRYSLATTARFLGVAKSTASILLDRTKRLTRGTYNEGRKEPSVTFAAIWVGRFVRFAAIDFHRISAPSEKPGELTPDLVSTSLERNALLDFEQELTKIESDCASANPDGLDARSSCAQQIRAFLRFLRLVSLPPEKGILRCALLELVVPSNRRTRMESFVTKIITRVVGAHSLDIVPQDFSRSLLQTMASVPSHSVSTGFFPDIRNAVLPSLRTIRAGVSSYQGTFPDVPHYGSKPRREIRGESQGRLYSSVGRSSEPAPLFPQTSARISPVDGEHTIDTTDTWQTLFATLTSGEFSTFVTEVGMHQLKKAVNLEGGVNSLIPWLTEPDRVVADLLAGARGNSLKERLACGLAFLHFSPQFILEGAPASLVPLREKWGEQIVEGLDTAFQDEAPPFVLIQKHQNEFACHFAQSLLIEHINNIRDAFVAAIRADLPRFSEILFAPATLAENSALRSFWPSSIRFTKERLHLAFRAYHESYQAALKRPRFVSMDRNFDGESGAACLHQCLSKEQEVDWESVADDFRVRLVKGEKSLEGEIATDAAIHIAQMLQDQGKDLAGFTGLLPRKMARQVLQAIAR